MLTISQEAVGVEVAAAEVVEVEVSFARPRARTPATADTHQAEEVAVVDRMRYRT